MKLAKSFLKYQQERFPLLFLVPISLSGIMGAAAILGVHNWVFITGATCITVSFLFHIRVIDEVRDLSHDEEFHPNRPVQRNMISISELKTLRILCLIVFFGLSAVFSFKTLFLAMVLFLYSSFAGRDFFCSREIRKHFYVYNILNMIQLVGLQMVVYSALGWSLSFGRLVIANMLMIFLLSALLEIVRKIKIEEHENIGKDTYSYHLGHKGSLILFAGVFAAVLLPFGYTLSLADRMGGLITPAIICVAGLSMTWVHGKQKTRRTQDLLSLISIIYYLTINVMLYVLIR